MGGAEVEARPILLGTHPGRAPGIPEVRAWMGWVLRGGGGGCRGGKRDRGGTGSARRAAVHAAPPRGGLEDWDGRRAHGGGAPVSPDRVVLRGYRLWAVLGLGGGSKARGVSGLNGESPTLRGLLGTHVQAPGRSARGVAVRLLQGRGAPPPHARPLGRCSPAGGRGRTQAGSSCPSPGCGRTLRSKRSRAGVCGASGPGRRGEGLHCDPGHGALTSQNPFLRPRNSPPPPAALALSAAASRELEGSGHGALTLGPADPSFPMGAQEATGASTKRSLASRAAQTPDCAPVPQGLQLSAWCRGGGGAVT